MVRAHNDNSVLSIATQSRRSRRRRILRTAALAAVAGTALWAQTAQATSFFVSWAGATSGSWGDGTKWTPAGTPNNWGTAPNTGEYLVTIDANSGPAYTVTSNGTIVVNDLHLTSPTATLALTGGSFTSLGGVNLGAGTFLLNGGALVNSSLNFNGGTMLVSNSSN